jgi:hypothetical protein
MLFQNAELYQGRNSALAEVVEAEAEVLEVLEEEDVKIIKVCRLILG